MSSSSIKMKENKNAATGNIYIVVPRQKKGKRDKTVKTGRFGHTIT